MIFRRKKVSWPVYTSKVLKQRPSLMYRQRPILDDFTRQLTGAWMAFASVNSDFRGYLTCSCGAGFHHQAQGVHPAE